jgi:hypothetical protein
VLHLAEEDDALIKLAAAADKLALKNVGANQISSSLNAFNLRFERRPSHGN